MYLVVVDLFVFFGKSLVVVAVVGVEFGSCSGSGCPRPTSVFRKHMLHICVANRISYN